MECWPQASVQTPCELQESALHDSLLRAERMGVNSEEREVMFESRLLVWPSSPDHGVLVRNEIHKKGQV